MTYKNIRFMSRVRFIKLFLIFSAYSLCFCAAVSNANQANLDAAVYLHYEDMYFTEAHKNQDPKNAVSAAMLLVVNELSNKVQIEYLPTARSIIKFSEDTDDAICALFKLKSSEREARYYFSLPIGFMQTHRLFLRKDMGPLDASLINKQGELKQISNLFEVYPDKTLILWENISQGDYIDRALDKVAEKNKVSIQGMTSYTNLAKLILRSRADFAILPPAELTHHEKDASSLNLLSYRIEGIEPVSKVYMMCNKSDASKRFLATVNKIIRGLYKTPEYMSASLLNVSKNEAPFVVNAIEDVKQQIK